MPTQDTACTTPDHVGSYLSHILAGAAGAALVAGLTAAALGGSAAFAAGIGVIFAGLGGLAGFCDWFFNYRLVCIGADQAAVAKVHLTSVGFDGDFTMDTLLSPNVPGATLAEIQASLPSGFLMEDKFPGVLPYVPDAAGALWSGSPIFHIEIEGTRMKAVCIGGTLGGAIGAAAGVIAFAGCAAAVGWTIIGLLFCLLVAVVIALVGLAAGAGIGYAVGSEATPNDAGETRDITDNDCIAFRGRWIYDSGHEGWNEIHAVMRIMKLDEDCAKLTPDRIKFLIGQLREADDPGTHSQQLRRADNHFLVHRKVG